MCTKRSLVCGSLVLPVFLAMNWDCSALQPGTVTPGEKDIALVRTYAQPRPPAASVGFHKTFKLGWSSLDTLGPRIDAARQAGDPVALAHLSTELHVAEKVSGKTAFLTSTALLKESAQLAKLRNEVSELKAALQVSKQIQAEQSLGDEFQKDIQNAESAAQKQAKTVAAPPPLNPVVYPVRIENYTDVPISIFMNGRLQFTVQPLKKQFLNIVQQPAPVVLHGYSLENTWGPRNIWETLNSYDWVLLPPKSNDCKEE